VDHSRRPLRTETNKRPEVLQTQHSTLQTEYAALQRCLEIQREAGIKAAEEARRLFDKWRRQEEEERPRAELET
jgi:hypothetical protein